MSKSQVEIVENAARLAADLQAGPVVTKTALLSVVANFMSDPAGDLKRLRRILELLKDGSGGHLKRGAGFGDQVQLVIQEVLRVLDRGEWEPEEIRSLFGWTGRLLSVRQPPREEKQKQARGAGPETRQSGRPARHDRRPSSPGQKKPPSEPAKPFRALSGKNLDMLRSIREQLPDSEEEKS